MSSHLPDDLVTESWRQALRVLQSMDAHERKHHFDMNFWGNQTDCGTVACLAGHCSLDSWFHQERDFYGEWKRGSLRFRGRTLVDVFGAEYGQIFYMCAGHTEVVRAVMRLISRRSGEPIIPFGFGMLGVVRA